MIAFVANCSTPVPVADESPAPTQTPEPVGSDQPTDEAQAHAASSPRLAYAHAHGCLRQGKRLACWGNNEYGSLGPESDDCGPRRCWRAPRVLPGEADEVTLGWHHMCVRQGDSVACRGSNDMLQLGAGEHVDGQCRVAVGAEQRCQFNFETGTVRDCKEISPESIQAFPCAPDLVEIAAEGAEWIEASDFATCVGTSDATLCAGYGFGELASDLPQKCGPWGDEPCAATLHPLDVGATASVFAGQNGRWCTRDRDGVLRCGNPLRQLDGLDDVVDFATGRPACALRGDATLWCEGEGGPVQVLEHVVDVATDTHACAVTDDGALWCWGANDAGQLGLGDREARKQPTQLELSDVAEVEVGYERTCALRRDGVVWCWGSDEAGALGIGDGPRERCKSAGIGVGAVPCVLEPRRVPIDFGA